MKNKLALLLLICPLSLFASEGLVSGDVVTFKVSAAGVEENIVAEVEEVYTNGTAKILTKNAFSNPELVVSTAVLSKALQCYQGTCMGDLRSYEVVAAGWPLKVQGVVQFIFENGLCVVNNQFINIELLSK